MRSRSALLALPLLLALGSPAMAQQSIADEVLEGCSSELESYCSEVTPGEGRILACLYAHGDKLSNQCEFALYNASARLERAVNAISYVAAECRSDIEELCGDVEMGEGRIAQCLVDNEAELESSCSQALSDVGLK